MGGDSGQGADGVLDGIVRVAGAWALLPAGRTEALAPAEGAADGTLAAGWDLLAFAPTGELVVEVLDASGARVEVVEGVPATWGRGRRADEGDRGDRGGREGRGDRGGPGSGDGSTSPRVTSHGPAAAAWGAPPGRRITAMGLVPGPGGTVVQASCALVLRVPAAALVDPARVAYAVAFHGAMHALERRSLPSPPRLAAALDALFQARGAVTGRDLVGWAVDVALAVVGELRLDPPCVAGGAPYSGH